MKLVQACLCDVDCRVPGLSTSLHQLSVASFVSSLASWLQKKLTICSFILCRLEVQEVQISQMQMELTTLGQVQLEFEEYKKKVEASTR